MMLQKVIFDMKASLNWNTHNMPEFIESFLSNRWFYKKKITGLIDSPCCGWMCSVLPQVSGELIALPDLPLGPCADAWCKIKSGRCVQEQKYSNKAKKKKNPFRSAKKKKSKGVHRSA